MAGKIYTETGAIGGLFAGLNLGEYTDAFAKAYIAMGSGLSGKNGYLNDAGKKWLDSVLFSAFVRGIGGIAAQSNAFDGDFCGTDDERIIVESAVGAYVMDKFVSEAHRLGATCSSNPVFAPKIFEAVCAGVVERTGGDQDAYRKKLRSTDDPASSHELRESLENADSKLN